ncbi:hypothetical protein BDW59DRAFT_56215 [Aspergillus cavernicola]|uniref:Uncharacterized protein n=1 Tax=Aspergillus cavernicola TaxID=176166 RepID=A0ABR4IIN2_9EURO
MSGQPHGLPPQHSTQGGSNHYYPDALLPGAEQLSRKEKQRPLARSLSCALDSSIPASCHYSHDSHEVRGRAVLSVESQSRLKPAYYFTFVPDASLHFIHKSYK